MSWEYQKDYFKDFKRGYFKYTKDKKASWLFNEVRNELYYFTLADIKRLVKKLKQ
jgi:hypothetical protein